MDIITINHIFSQLTVIFITVLIIAFSWSIRCRQKSAHYAFTQYTPTLLTSIGILGTFSGIVFGLMDFNVNDIDGSVPQLLEGLKTAFISSFEVVLPFVPVIPIIGIVSRFLW